MKICSDIVVFELLSVYKTKENTLLGAALFFVISLEN